MISMYNIQQSIQQSETFGFEARIRYEGVVAGCKGEGNIAVIRSLELMRIMYAY